MLNPAPIVDLIDAFRRSKVLFVAMSFGIFDRLRGASTSCAELAQELEADPDALERLLDALILRAISKSLINIECISSILETDSGFT